MRDQIHGFSGKLSAHFSAPKSRFIEEAVFGILSRRSRRARTTRSSERWIEETIRFVKQSYRLEEIRVMTYHERKNLVALVHAASSFAAVHLGEGLKRRILARHVLRVAKRFFGVPDFHYYALADGIATVLSHATIGPIARHGKAPPRSPDPQLSLCLD